ncbi:Asparaginyl-tRNA synthetase [Handroanthus impetiginosus]|uniref:asparagine--tRNA ligase n=1 Tax=Handroanthus impetiginosus TaxID=429701 RepID=A0A2G9HTU9_9LAMI|nr:Asparaginyl-tRNA synthetase [Handroanthus impetiginosus]
MASDGQAPIEAPVLPLSKYSKRVLLKMILGRSDGGLGLMGQKVVVGGWVKSSREFRMAPEVVEPKESCLETKLTFFQSILIVFIGEHRGRDKLDAILPKPPQRSISILQVGDGSCASNLQVIVESYLAPPSEVMPTGTCILAEGLLQKPSLQGKGTIELKAEKILHIGLVEMDSYPLSKKSLPLELLRDSAHFRPRTTTVASVMRIRSALTQAIHAFFQENGFFHVQVPIITTTDCEGLGKNFQVTTLLDEEKLEDQTIVEDVRLENIKASIKEKSEKVEELKRSPSNKEALAAAIQDLKKASDLVSHLEAKQKAKSGKSAKVDFSEDFFSCKTYLTASGRLHLESFASALGNVYSFGPRFNATKSNSKKLLAEMWILDLEMAFSQLEDSMECASDFLKFICKWMLENCEEDLKFVAKRIDKLVVHRLRLIATDSFEKISYTEAVEVLKQITERKFEKEVQWGSPFGEEHESYLTDEIYKKPLIIYNHPKELAPFYVHLNDDGKTAAAFDVIVPKVGSLIRGGQNEERLNILSTRIEELGLEKQQYEWYLDLRRHGAVRSSGFSFFFDPLILYATGLNDARDAVPFPRSFGKANN